MSRHPKPHIPPAPEPATLWSKRSDETAQQYATFLKYLMLGHSRSLERARAVALQEGIIKAASCRWVAEWSRKHSWVARAGAWDAEQARQTRERFEQQDVDDRLSAARRHAAIGRTLQDVALRRLQAIMRSPDELRRLTPSDLRNYLVDGVRVERLGLGLETERQAVHSRVHVDADVQTTISPTDELDLSTLPEEYLTLLEAMAERIKPK